MVSEPNVVVQVDTNYDGMRTHVGIIRGIEREELVLVIQFNYLNVWRRGEAGVPIYGDNLMLSVFTIWFTR